MTETPPPGADDLGRFIMLIYGSLESGTPFWCYAAVKPSQYKAFVAAQDGGTLDLQNFSPYGELIVAGKGEAPSDEITLKVAKAYQTDPATLFKQLENPEAAIAEHVENLKKKKEEKKKKKPVT